MATVKQALTKSRTSCLVPTGVGEAGLDEFVEQLVGDGVAGLVVFGHPQQRFLLPNPVLQHLRRSLYEVPLHMSPAEHGVVRLQTHDTRNQLTRGAPTTRSQPIRTHLTWSRLSGFSAHVGHKSVSRFIYSNSLKTRVVNRVWIQR